MQYNTFYPSPQKYQIYCYLHMSQITHNFVIFHAVEQKLAISQLPREKNYTFFLLIVLHKMCKMLSRLVNMLWQDILYNFGASLVWIVLGFGFFRLSKQPKKGGRRGGFRMITFSKDRWYRWLCSIWRILKIGSFYFYNCT